MNPTDRKYTRTHEWIKIEGTTASVGITDHAQDALGDITFVDLPKPGTNLTKGGECGVIESVKAASDLYSPLSGEVTEANAALESAPEKINSDPFGEGWLFKMKNVGIGDAADLLDAAAYEKFLETEQ